MEVTIFIVETSVGFGRFFGGADSEKFVDFYSFLSFFPFDVSLTMTVACYVPLFSFCFLFVPSAALHVANRALFPPSSYKYYYSRLSPSNDPFFFTIIML